MHKVKLYNIETGEELVNLLPLPSDEEEQFQVLEKLLLNTELLRPGTKWNVVASPANLLWPA